MIKDTDKSAHEIGFDAQTLIKGGGCAFPFIIELDDDKSMAYSHGMTLRDYFAAKAMQGIVSDPDLAMGCNKIAEWAYTQADAMLQARNN